MQEDEVVAPFSCGAVSRLICRQVVASIDNRAAGPTYSVTALSEALRARGTDSVVMAVGRRASVPGIEIFRQDLSQVPLARRLMFSREMVRALDAIAERGGVLHGHGLWLMPNIYPASASRHYGVPLIVSPRGMLGREALLFSHNSKRLMWTLAQHRALKVARCFHATSESEAEDVRRAGLTAPIAIIPNGIHIPPSTTSHRARTVLYLGRLHPKKGIDRLVAAWAQIAKQHSDWRLRIVGPSEVGYRASLEAQVKELRAPRVDFDGALYGDEKLAAFRQAGIFVLPTLNENFGMVIAEALAAGIPAICTKGAPWQGLESARCGWWVDHGSDAIAAALDTALTLPDAERTAMGARGTAWMQRDFGWDGIAARMAQVYTWCMGRGAQPDCVIR